MNHTSDTTAAGNGGTFGPEQAAALLDQTTQQARRKFQPSPPWLLATRAVLVLAALGAIWLSVRGQHPYRGPTAADIPVLVAFIVVNFAATVAVRRHATAGVSGRSRFSQGEIAVLVLAFVAAVVAMAALGAAGVSFASYPTSVLVIPGLAWAVLTAARRKLARARYRTRDRRHRHRGRVRRTGRGVGGRRRGPVRRAPGQRRRRRLAAARLTARHERRRT